jgi:hypothetical protein
MAGSGGGGFSPGASGTSLLALGLSACGDVEKGAATQASDEFQADKAAEHAKFGRLQADLADTSYREKLNTTLGNIDAVRAASHVDPTSPTTQAVEGWQTEISNRQRLAAVGTERAQAASDDASAAYLRQAGQFAQQQGYLSAAARVAGANFALGSSNNLGTGGMGLPAGAATGGLY